MYKKKKEGWLKHLDFIIWDILCLQLSFILAYGIRMKSLHPYADQRYLELAIVSVLVDFCVVVVFESFKNVLKRGIYKEFVASVKHVFLVEGLVLFFFFAVPHGCGILVHLLGIETGASPVKAQSLNHWTAREFLECSLLPQDLCI